MLGRKKIKLNLGCGTDIKEGFINIDSRDIEGVNRICNLEKPLPYKKNSVDCILAKDILEHFSWRNTAKIFEEWIKVLKKNGTIEIQVPNFEVHYQYFKESVTNKRYKGAIGFFIANIFGGQDYSGNFHKTLFIPKTVKELFENNNLKIIKFELYKRAIMCEGKKA